MGYLLHNKANTLIFVFIYSGVYAVYIFIQENLIPGIRHPNTGVPICRAVLLSGTAGRKRKGRSVIKDTVAVAKTSDS